MHLTPSCADPLLLQPLLRERQSIIRLQTLWLTPLTPEHVLAFHVQNATDIALHISGKPPRPLTLHWLPSRVSPSTEYHDDLHSDADTDECADEWDDIPHLDSAQEMFADVITEDHATEIQIDSVWAPPVCDSTRYSQF